MIIDLKKYFHDRTDVETAEERFEYQLSLAGLELDGVKPFCAPVAVSAAIHGFAGSAILNAHAEYQLTMPCDRCCETVTKTFRRDFSHTLVHRLDSEQEDETIIPVPDERLDLDELIREDILLDMPSKFLCKEDCKGLCPRCGKNLNEGECGCGKGEIDPRLEALRSLLEQ